MIEKIIIAGAGGQGIMLMGKVLASACLKENKHVTWMPSYGAEVRGGTAHCLVVISDEEIGSPYIKEADTLIIMNEPSWRRFKSRVKEKGLSVVNSSLVKNTENNIGVLQYPFTDIALKLGNIKVANMVALGCYIDKKKIINVSSILEVIKEMAPQDKKNLIAINKQALEEGLKLK
jgi:2-oxoglutarate ferredoxin oxidoreductase subunit gamma